MLRLGEFALVAAARASLLLALIIIRQKWTGLSKKDRPSVVRLLEALLALGEYFQGYVASRCILNQRNQALALSC